MSRRAIVPILLLAIWPATSMTAAPLERSVSTSRQFIIYGVNVPVRGAMGDLAEKTKSSLLGILRRRDGWKTPIILNLQFPQANVPEIPPSQLRVSQTGMGLKLQLDLTIPANIDTSAIQRDLLRAMLVEMIYREHADIPAGTAYVEAPGWLIEGVLAWNSAGQKQTLNSLLTAAAESHRIIPLDAFLRQKPEQLDSQGRLLYQAYAAALLQLLVDQPAGPTRLAAYIESLSRASNDPLFDLKTQFATLGSGEALEAVWTSAVARFASTARYEFLLGFHETDQQLENLLHTKIPNPKARAKPLELEKLGHVRPVAGQVGALRALSQNLLLLSASAHPLMRPVVVEYQQIAQVLSTRKEGKTAERLARVKATRAGIVRRMSDIDDYMNWFEATQLQTSSGAFNDYLKAAGASDELERRRRDALSVYLDAVEAQFQN